VRAGRRPVEAEAITVELEAFASCLNWLFWPGLAALVPGWRRR
jgi:hypothetical protein